MRPRDMPSRWVRILPWYYTERKQPARQTVLFAVLTFEEDADQEEACMYNLEVVQSDHGKADEYLPDR